MQVLVVYGSKMGGTEGIAQILADELGARGATVTVADAATDPDPAGADREIGRAHV